MRFRLLKVLQVGLICLLIVCCNENKQERKIDMNENEYIISGNSKIDKIEVYCLCMLNDPLLEGGGIKVGKVCNYELPIFPSDLISSNHLLTSTTDSSIISSFEKLAFQKKDSFQLIHGWKDTRFVVLARRNDKITDTIANTFAEPNRLVYNAKYSYYYNFYLIDSIRRILKMKKIDCPG